MFSKEEIQNLYLELIKFEETNDLHKKARLLLLESSGLNGNKIPDDFKHFRKGCIIYKANNFDIKKTIDFIYKYKRYTKGTLYKIKGALLRTFEQYYDMAKIKNEITKNRNAYQKIDKSVDRVKKVLNFFNLHSENLKEKLKKIYIGEDIPQEEYLKELYTLRQLFLAKAKGEITQTTTNVIYEIEEDENGNIIKKQVYTNKNGKKLMNVEYKSQLPDEKSLVALRVVDEMIIQASVNNDNTIDDEELEMMFNKYLEDTKKQREEFMLIEDKK